MNAVMTVDLSELDAWSAQVQRAGDDLTGIARNGGHNRNFLFDEVPTDDG